jgi:hypothetical protein
MELLIDTIAWVHLVTIAHTAPPLFGLRVRTALDLAPPVCSPPDDLRRRLRLSRRSRHRPQSLGAGSAGGKAG